MLAADAAPSADATVSGISFGPWHTPARKTPAVVVPHGLSFGWASRSQPSIDFETPKSLRVFSVDSHGSTAAASTTMSTSRLIGRLRRVSSALMRRFLVLGSSSTFATRPRMNFAPSSWMR
ncbi:MAG: hypothetical protein A4E38_00245 [Methanoregulaceae archaeon PtaB.Bin108]|nr:MAG: hypothetical protein A4E38_00245 [Methanoregulaceae archaeon PtaB.Bin108]